MGEVKETVKGIPPKKKLEEGNGKNLQQRVTELMDDLSDCINKKDKELEKVVDSEMAEDMRKAGLLRATFTLLSCAKHLLEEY